ncbi:MAG: MBL fold metallo-hydrolase [Desulfobacteraceae bacterium]|nr:MAG: MBL fold metallo-hydrolase [Desulfobacteraceae bacterium]
MAAYQRNFIMLDLIDLDVPELGYTRFISAWLYQGTEANFLVDPGPACTTRMLFDELDRRGIRRLDWVFLTHIHMDHSGGIGHVVRRFPEAKVVCHEKAVQHLVDPERLWEGSLKILGNVAEVYGKILPVPPENIVTAGEIPFEGGVRVIPTPGHAAHHQCFAGKDFFFCGEVFGIFHELDDSIYLRPATPPVFVLEDFLTSMDAVTPFLDRPLCFSHYGRWFDGLQILETARAQLLLWVEVVNRHRTHNEHPDIQAIIDDLTAADPVYARKKHLPPQILKRENFFSINTIRGMLQYLEKKDG